jgi:hypothetical protein
MRVRSHVQRRKSVLDVLKEFFFSEFEVGVGRSGPVGSRSVSVCTDQGQI